MLFHCLQLDTQILTFSLESLLTHSHNYVDWIATHLFRLPFTHFFSTTVPLFLCNCYTRTFPDCFQVHTPFCFFLLSHWWPVITIMFFRLGHIFDSFSKWNFTTFFFVWMSHNFHGKVSLLSMSEPSVANLPPCFMWLSHKAPVKFFCCFQLDTLFIISFLSHWWSILIVLLCGLPLFFFICLSFFSMELFYFACVTVTQGPYHVSLFPSRHSTLLLSFESLLTHFHNYVM